MLARNRFTVKDEVKSRISYQALRLANVIERVKSMQRGSNLAQLSMQTLFTVQSKSIFIL